MGDFETHALDVESSNRFIQFELWKDCRNGCKFCFNRGLPDMDKLESLKFVMNVLNSDKMGNFNEVGFIGGEFFDDQLDNPEVNDGFMGLFQKCSDMVHEGKIQKIYVTTSFLYRDMTRFEEFAFFLRHCGILENVLFCTSYDTVGRFNEINTEELWKTNILKVKEMFPEMRLHTEIIITQDFIERVLDGRFDIVKFQNEFSTSIDYLEPNTGSYYDGKDEFNRNVPGFLPKRKDFLRFLKKTCIEDKSIELFKLFSKRIRSDVIYLILKGKHVEICGRRNGTRLMGINLPILPRFGYVDSDVDIADDVEQFRSIYGE